MLPKIHFLAGPTAVGKTALALRWASEHGAEIINADALLFYCGMDIGTAKPTAPELAMVPHHLIDIAPPDQPMSIKRYAAATEAIVHDIVQTRGKPVLVAGGSGFYLKSFFTPVVDEVESSPQVRMQVEALEAEGLPALLAALRCASPSGTGGVDLLNPRRVARALERCLTTGRSIPQLEADFAALPRPFADYQKRFCLLLAPDPVIHPRIHARTRHMLAGGLLQEVQALLAAGIERNPAAASAIGYRETIAHLKAKADAQPETAATGTDDDCEALARQIDQNTRRLVAKQRKWFRTQVRPDLTLRRDTEAPGTDDALYARMCACFGSP